MDIREISKISLLEGLNSDGAVFKTERGYIIAIADEWGCICIPSNLMNPLIEKCKTRFFRLDERQGEIVLTPVKVQLELVENDESLLDNPRAEKNLALGENSGRSEDSTQIESIGEI